MIKYTLINIKNSLKSKYFVLGILLVLGTFFSCIGPGELCVQQQEKPLLFQELLRYSKKEFEKNIFIYNSAAIFSYGMRKMMYLVMPLAGLGFLLRFCDERYGGFDRMILARVGKRRYLVGTLLTSAVLSAITIVVSCLIILAVLYIQLPSAALMGVSNGLGACMAQVGYAGILAIVGGWTGFAVAVITESRFLSMVLPVMLFEVWKELCIGSVSYKVAQFAVPYLFDPITNGMRVEAYVLFIILILIILGGGFYLIAAKKFEKGR